MVEEDTEHLIYETCYMGGSKDGRPDMGSSKRGIPVSPSRGVRAQREGADGQGDESTGWRSQPGRSPGLIRTRGRKSLGSGRGSVPAN